MTERQWSMRPFVDGDEDKIRALFALVFAKEISHEQWKWQYVDNHTDLVMITVAEGMGGELAGHYALRPVRMKIGDEICLGTLSLDTMVHPGYRRQGMFTKLARHMYHAAAEQGIPLTYGFPNKNSHHGLVNKLNWVDLCGRLPLFVKILDTRNVLSNLINNKLLLSMAAPLGKATLGLIGSLRRNTLPADCQLVEVAQFDERATSLWERASASYPIMVVRDREYLNWRYVENPTEEYVIFVVERHSEIAAYIVLKCEQRFGLEVGFIVDLLTIPGEPTIGGGLISEAVHFFQRQRMDMVGCLVLQHTPFVHSLANNGFVMVPKRLLPQELYLGVLRHTNEFPEHFITNSENWFITFGDHDVI